MSTEKDLISISVISKAPESVYYCTEDDWRNFTTFTNSYDFPSSVVTAAIADATEQIKKDGFYMIRQELVTKNSDKEYYIIKRFLANKYKRNDDIPIINGTVTKYDMEFFYLDSDSVSASASIYNFGKYNFRYKEIPFDDVTFLDPVNCYFKLDTAYDEKQIYVTYWVSGKPLHELSYELKMACIEMTTILVLKKAKTLRLKDGTVNYTLGKQTISRDEKVFDEMLKEHKVEYEKWITWFKPFIGKRVRIGRMETRDRTRLRYR